MPLPSLLTLLFVAQLTKFGAVTEFDKFSPKLPKIYVNVEL